MARWLEGRLAAANETAERAARERDEALVRADASNPEFERLRREADELRAEVARAGERVARLERAPKPVAPEPPPVQAGDAASLMTEIESLSRANADLADRLRVALRKAEHNRRAYVVTMSQLDLAEDRIHILTKGTPRPVHVEREVETAAGPVEAVEVEGYEVPEEA